MKENNKVIKQILLLLVFSIAMGLLEAVIAIYLRLLYYPNGFDFPLKQLSAQVYQVELIRELATLVMLVCICVLVGKGFYERLAYFLLTFGSWDLFYYIFLKILIDWPETLLDWDILFLIPIVWVGPVLAPVICSLMMLIISYLILYFGLKVKNPRFTNSEWIFLLTGSIIILYTFFRDYALLILSTPIDVDSIQKRISKYVPDNYGWPWFIVGFGLIAIAIYIWSKRVLQQLDKIN